MRAHRFEAASRRQIPELGSEATWFRHPTGAQLVSVVNGDDANKVFGITFRTPPSDSTGIAHILEHSVLCGSRKYPVKEPFVELLKGSLKTFLNAFTYPDRTCYPVASQNLRDFHNLVDVYLDAVFHPRLTPEVLKQEGWHYEVEEGGELSFGGVVYNEMKGAYSSPERVLGEAIQQGLFPDTTYGVESGGHPRHIPDLTWERFSAFHRDLYHPGNAFIWFYGDDPPGRRLEILEEYLEEFEPRPVDSAVGAQPRWTEPRRCDRTYAAGDGDGGGKHYVTVNWLLPPAADFESRLGLEILDHVLLGTPASPLRKALIDSGLGEDLAGSGMETELKEVLFSAGLKGVAAGDEEKAAELVTETLRRLAREGLDGETVRASLNTCEFRLRENNTGPWPRGLILMLRSLTGWLYGGDPFEPMAFEAPLAAVRERARRAGWLEGLIERCLLDNPHRTTLFLRPDPGQAEREERQERERLAAARAELDDAEVERLRAEARQLRARQEAPDDPADLAKLPRLELADLDRQVRTIPLERAEAGGAPVFYHDLFTNGIVYLDVGFDLRAVPQELLPLLPLFGRCLLEAGTETEDFVRLSQRIGSRTGGLSAHSLVSGRRGGDRAVARFFLRGKATADRTGDLVDILRDVLTTVRLDNRDRLLQMALEDKAGEEAGLVPGGHSVVALRLGSQFDEASWVSEQMEGVTYLFFLRRLVDRIRGDWPSVLEQLEAVRAHLVDRDTLLLNATLADADRAAVEPHLAGLAQSLPARGGGPQVWSPRLGGPDEGLTLPAQVNYVGKAGDLYAQGYELRGSVAVITKFLRTSYLWDRVRVQGGAYGVFCSFDPFAGVFGFGSYRDPRLLETLRVYDGAAAFLRGLDLSEDERVKAIIGAIGEMDAYQLPDARGYTSMVRELTGVDDDYRQSLRDHVLGTTAADFRDFGERLEGLAGAGRVVVLGSPEAIESANAERGGGWLRVVPVL